MEAVAYCLGLTDKKETFKRWLDITGGSDCGGFTPVPKSPISVASRSAPRPQPFKFYKSVEGCRALSKKRNIDCQSLLRAQEFGWLRFGEDKRHGEYHRNCYFVTNLAQSFFIARRIDGGLLPTKNGGAKSVSLYGSRGRTIGSESFDSYKKYPILFVEGEVDFLSAIDACEQLFTIANEIWKPFAVLGASSTIPPDDLIAFSNRRVVIIADLGSVGEAAAQKWARQLVDHNCEVDIIKTADIAAFLDEPRITDLNDIYRYFPNQLPGILKQITSR